MRSSHLASLILFFALAVSAARADVKLPAIFGDHMVLQRDAKVSFWGWADPDEPVKITAGDAGAAVTAGADGKWSAKLEGLKASDRPVDVTIVGKNTLTLKDVLVGDVWVCSGQSNMEFSLNEAHNAREEIPKADHPLIRLFIVKHKIAFEPQSDCVGSWEVCTPRTAPRFSAVGYFFARDIQEDQHAPVGMIGAYWGGTPAESWTRLETLKAHPELAGSAGAFERTRGNLTQLKSDYATKVLPEWKLQHEQWAKEVDQPYKEALKQWPSVAAKAKAAGQSEPPKPVLLKKEPGKPVAPDENPYLPTVLSNGMVAPIVPYTIKGVIWYQGESNSGNPKAYQVLFPAMITDWRERWGEGDFAFLWVQLANFYGRELNPTQTPDGWAGLREAQSMTLKLPNTGQAVIVDIGQGDNIHPKDKLDVGHRLALGARHVVYGEPIVYSGPTYDSMKVDGDKVRVTFKNVGSGLTIAAAPSTQPGVPPERPSSELKGFSIAGADHKFVWATASIEAADTVVVSSPQVKQPIAVRYGWANNPEVDLYNKEGLPASPFRTDGQEPLAR